MKNQTSTILVAIIFSTALSVIALPAYSAKSWTGLGFTSNWTNPLNWVPTGAPAKSSTENVIFDAASGPSTLNEHWTLGGLAIDTGGNLGDESEWLVSNGSILTIYEGISYRYSGCRPGALNYTGCRAKIRFPIKLGASAGIETTTGSTSWDPDNVITFYGEINTNGKTLFLQPEGADISLRGRVSGVGGVFKLGSGVVNLYTRNTYGGSTTVNDGMLYTRGGGRIPDTSDLRVNGDGIFISAIATADAVNGLYGDGRVGISGKDFLVIGNYAGYQSIGKGSFSGELFGDGSLTKRGRTGKQTLNGHINIGGRIFVEEGVLIIGPDASVSRKPDITIAPGAVLRLQSVLEFGNFYVNGLAGVSEETTVAGNYSQGTSAELLIGIAGLDAVTDFGVVSVGNMATLDGVLSVELLDDFIPEAGDSFVFLTAPTIQGEFSSFDLPHIPGISWEIDFLNDGEKDYVRLSAAVDYCDGDFDEDGDIDALDLSDFIEAFNLGNLIADFNDDGSVDKFDLEIFVQNYGEEICP